MGLFSRVSPEIKELFDDIVHSLDMKSNETMEFIIQYYHEKANIKPRPSRERLESRIQGEPGTGLLKRSHGIPVSEGCFLNT